MNNQKLLPIIFAVSVGFTLVANGQQEFQSWSGQVFDSSNSPTVYTPRNLTQIVQIIKKASADKIKLRVSGARHSWNSIIIGDNSTYLSTVDLTKIGPIEVKNGKTVISVEPGVMLGTLTDYLFERGYSLGFSMPEFRGLTIAGLIATGSHGSSRKHIAASNQIVNRVQIVTATGDVRDLTAQDGDLFKAATVNWGVVGVVSQVELILQPRFNLKVTSSPMDLQKDSLVDFLKAPAKEDFLFVMWFPKLKKAILESAEITTEAALPGAENVIFGLNIGTLPEDYAAANILAKGRADASGAIESAIEAKRFDGLVANPRFVVESNGVDARKSVVVGPSNKILLARGDVITWPYKLSDYSFSFPLSDLSAVMNTIETFANQKNYSFPNAGISMRFVRSDDGQSSMLSTFQDDDHKGELFVSADFLEFRAFDQKGMTEGPRDALRKELLQLLVSQNHVRFHMGKNDDWALKLQPDYKNSENNYARFSNVVKQMDPNGMFMTGYVQQILKTRTGN